MWVSEKFARPRRLCRALWRPSVPNYTGARDFARLPNLAPGLLVVSYVHRRAPWIAVATVAATAATGCASNDGIEVSHEEYDDLAMSLASTAHTGGGGGELGAMADVMTLASGGQVEGFTIADDGMIRGQHQGLHYEYELACWDAAGGRLATCDPSTERADVRVAWSGMLDTPLLAMAIERHGAWSLSDLRTGTTLLFGDGHMAYESSIANPDRGETTTYTLASDPTYDSIAITNAPMGGTMHYAVDVAHMHATENRVDTRHFLIEANIEVRPGHVAIDLDSTHFYDVDLSTGVVVRVR